MKEEEEYLRCITGIEMYENQTKYINSVINNIEKIIQNDQTSSELANVFFKLTFFIEKHFITDENFLLKIGFDKFEKHKLSHNQYIEYMKTIESNHAIGEGEKFSELLQFLKQWREKHLISEHQEIIQFCNEQNL